MAEERRVHELAIREQIKLLSDRLSDSAPSARLLEDLSKAHLQQFKSDQFDGSTSFEHLMQATYYNFAAISIGDAEPADDGRKSQRLALNDELRTLRLNFRRSLETRAKSFEDNVPSSLRAQVHSDLFDAYDGEIKIYWGDDKQKREYGDIASCHLHAAIAHLEPKSARWLDSSSKLANFEFTRFADFGLKKHAVNAEYHARIVLQERHDDVHALLALCQTLTEKFKYTGDFQALDEAVDVGLNLVSREDQRKSETFLPHAECVLALALQTRATLGGEPSAVVLEETTSSRNPADLDLAIERHRRILGGEPAHLRSNENRDCPGLADLDVAIELFRTARASTPGGNVELKHICEIHLSLALMDRFRAREKRQDLEEARMILTEKSSSKNPSISRFPALKALGQLWFISYEYFGKHEDLYKAGSVALQVLRWRGAASTSVVTMECQILLSKTWSLALEFNKGANTLRTKEKHANDIALRIAEGIATTWNSDIVQVECWLQLAEIHSGRWSTFNTTKDRTVARKWAKRCWNALQGKRLAICRRVATKQIQIFRLADSPPSTKVFADLIWAALKCPSSLSKAEQVDFGHQVGHLPAYLSEKSTQRLEGLKQTLRHFQRLKAATPTLCIYAQLSLEDCEASQLADIAHATRTLGDYDRAIDACRSLTELCLQSDYGRSVIGWPYQLARLLFHKYSDFPNEVAAGEEALEKLTQRCMNNAASPFGERLDDLLKLRILQKKLNKGQDAIRQSFNKAIETFEYGVIEGHTLDEKMDLIRQYNGIAEQLASEGIVLGFDPKAAFTFLETVRAATWRNEADERESLIRLRAIDQTLEREYGALMREKSTYKYNILDDAPKEPHMFAQAYHNILRKIRRVDPSFMRPTDIFDITQEILGDIPMIALVTYEDANPSGPKRCAALIIRGDSFEQLPLPDFGPTQAQTFFTLMKACTNMIFDILRTTSTNPMLNEAIETMVQNVLKLTELPISPEFGGTALDALNSIYRMAQAMLWDYLAKPILDYLGMLGSATHPQELPRVYWVSSGWLGVIPIHAAGRHDEDPTNGVAHSVHDRVVSSYVPGLKALANLKKRDMALRTRSTVAQRKALLVGLKQVPGQIDLPNAPIEVEEIARELQPEYEVQTDIRTSSEAFTSLQSCSFAHFALHGQVDAKNPFRSSICFDEGCAASTLPMTVSNLVKRDLDHCRFVFLSICDAAVIRDEKLRNEGLHLAGAFHMAGVPSVVATWFPLIDRFTVDVSKEFYVRLRDDEGNLDFSKSARVLHATVSTLRRQYPLPYFWGVYSHFGL